MTIRLILILSLCLPLGACSRQPVYPSPLISGRNAVIEASSLRPEIPQFYTYHYQDKNISFFVVKLNEKIASFFDACASCYAHKRGYRGEGGSVVCRACGLEFSVYRLEKGLGGCYPLRIEGKMEKGRYLIPLASLEAEAGKF
jgi:uncharacterized membrane protein